MDTEQDKKRQPAAPWVRIEVTAEIIARSEQRNSSHCMIAEAIKEQHPEFSAISVDLQTIRFTDRKKGQRYTYLTPRRGQVGLVKFDQGIPTEPFSFQLRHGQVTRSGRKPAGPKQLAPPETGLRGMPRAVGGAAPPRAALPHGGHITAPGKRRAYGLRGLEL